MTNGLSLGSIDHRAFDQNLLGVDPDYVAHVAAALLAETDGPVLDLLKRAHGQPIAVPRREPLRPDREYLAERFPTFRAASAEARAVAARSLHAVANDLTGSLGRGDATAASDVDLVHPAITW